MNTQKINTTDWFIEVMQNENLMVYKRKNITYIDGKIQNFTLDNKLYIADYNEDLHKYYGDEYTGQSEINILTKYMNDISRSCMNSELT